MTFHLWSGESVSELQESLQLWLESMQARGLSPKTLRNYRDTVGRFLNFLESLNLRTLDAVQPHHIRKWLLHRQAHGVSNYELHNAYRQPRTFWSWCMREGLTENNPFAKVEKPRLMPTAKPALSPEEVQALLNACEGKDWRRMRDKALILLLLDTGLRIHEAHALTVGDAKQERLLIRGKGGKQRLVFLSPEVRLALRKYLNACPYPLNDDSPLWWGTYGALTLWGILEVIQKIGKRAGLPKHLGAHAFRRTFATWSLRSGIDLETLRQLMGHSDYSVLRQYLALVETDLKQAHQQHSPLRNLRLRK
ncbi:MAG: tyrosine-type recombinase/integrase [Fimbriimonadales bacterium]|nr:tyrosine-type recombinase/integrase [Fimbriimonadales bacterium]MCX7924293.1 tyrosine-type recombinase/integrase [Fimbriimonadales bacterium]